MPLSMDVVRCVGAALKAGRYCSAHMVLSAISNSNVYHGLQTHCTPERAHGGLLERLSWPQHGLEATWSLPASKADTAALGTMRTHGCSCKKGTLAEACPSRTLWEQRADLRSWFPERHSSEGIPCWDLQLFPTSSGEPCTKLGITPTIEAAAVQVGLPRRSPEGVTLWIGHSLRVGGLGRWGSEAVVLGYVRDAPLAMSHTWATRASTGPTLGVQLGAVVSEPSQQVKRAGVRHEHDDRRATERRRDLLAQHRVRGGTRATMRPG